MEKTNFNVLIFLVLFISLCNSNDYKYDDENYDYYDQKSRDYTDDYSQEYDYYGHQNLLAPAEFPVPPPPLIPPPPTPPPQPGNNIKHNCVVGIIG